MNYLTGEFRETFTLLDVPGVVGSTVVAITNRSAVTGLGQLGNGWMLSFEYTVAKTIVNVGSPESNGGHYAIVRHPTGFFARYDWTGSAYVPDACAVTETLTRPLGANDPYRLTFTDDTTIDFTNAGLPNVITDPRGNTTTLTYNGGGQLTGFEDDRGFDHTITRDADGFIEEWQNPTHRTWTFAYDSAGNLTHITTPATTHQTSGVVYEYGYDGSGRITTIRDGRGTLVKSIAYVGATYQVDYITMDGDTIDFAYTSGRTDRTDRLGHVFRTHYTGNKITQTDMWISSTATYVHTYSWGGDDRLAYEVLPRGNRIDYDWDADGLLLERRHRTTNTATNDSSDLVHTYTYADAFVATYTDPSGNVTEYTRNAAGDVTLVEFPDVTVPSSQTASRSYTYNSLGQLTQATDEEGKVTAYTYFTSGDDIHLLEKVEVDPLGLDLETTYSYDGYWNVDAVTDPNGATATYVSDALRRRIEVIAPSTLSYIKFEYDGDGRVTKKRVQQRDQDNAVVSANEWLDTTYTYTTLGDLASITEEIDASTTRTTTFDHDDEQQRIRVTLPEGNKVKTEYNERGLVKKVIRGETSGDASEREFFYDDNGNLIEEEDGRNNDTTHTVDLFDRRTRSTNAQGAYTEWTLNKNGQPTEVARKNSSNTTFLRQTRFYDERGRLWKTHDLHKDPSQNYTDAVTTITRYKTGHVNTVTDARSKTTTRYYDNAWRRTKVQDHAGNFTEWTLDDNGNPTAWMIHDEDGASDIEHEYEATYDALNRRVTTVEIDRTNGSNTYTTTNYFDSRSNLVFQVNAEGNPTRWTYDGLGRMLTRDVALTVGSPITNFSTYIRTQWGFDDNDRLVSHKDDTANETTWAYDALDRATTMTYPDSTDVTYTYDAEDNVTQTVDAIGNDIDDTYDSLGRRTSRAVTRASGVLDTTAETFTYDAMDRLLTAEDDDYEVEFAYGVLGLGSNVYQEKQQYATGTAYLKTVTKKYDAVGNKTTETYPSTLALTYSYTDVNQVSTIMNGFNPVAGYSYSGLRRKQLTLGNGSKTMFSYSGFRGEVGTIDHQDNSGNSLLKLEYGYNKLHDRTFERYGASGQPGDAFEYDKARRLTVAWMGSDTPASPSGNVYVKKIEYGMDDDGNRTTLTVTPYGSSPASTSYTDNNLNQYTVVGGVSRSHDGNGNVSDDGTYLYEYNYKNLICRVKLKSNSSTVAEYKYDALGRRVEKSVTGATYRYIYSGVETVSVYTSTGTWKQDYVYGSGIDEVLMLEQADVLDWDGDSNTTELARSWYRPNALGSVMRIEEPDKSEAVSYRYDPYGEVTITRGGSAQGSDPLGQYLTYTGRWRDEETGLYHFRARAYDPVKGRFLQRDPLGVLLDAQLYEYVRSMPIVFVDPLGLESEQPWSTLPAIKHQDGMDALKKRFLSCCGLGREACKVCCEKTAQEGSIALASGQGARLKGIEQHHQATLNALMGHALHQGVQNVVSGITGLIKSKNIWKAFKKIEDTIKQIEDPNSQLVLKNLDPDGKLKEDLANLKEEYEGYEAQLKQMHSDCLDCCKAEEGDYLLPSSEASWDWIITKSGKGQECHPDGVDERFKPLDKPHPKLSVPPPSKKN
ncbi:MAG: RHS repeat-associated core domain-containing protein [Planctomycetia bacterium]